MSLSSENLSRSASWESGSLIFLKNRSRCQVSEKKTVNFSVFQGRAGRPLATCSSFI